MANPLKHIKLPDGLILDLVGDNYFTQRELGQQFSSVNTNASFVNNIFTITPEVIDILKDENRIAGRIYSYKPTIYPTNSFNVKVDGNTSISTGNIGILKLKMGSVATTDITEIAISKYAPDADVMRGNHKVKNNFNVDYIPIINHGYGISKYTPLPSHANVQIGIDDPDFPMFADWADYLCEGQVSLNDDDVISVYENYSLNSQFEIELYDDDNSDFPFITSISKTSGFFTISGKNINSARLTTYDLSGNIVMSQMFNHVDNAVQVAQRAITGTESILTKIEICNQLTFDAVHKGNFTVYINNLSNTILNLS